MPTCPFTKELFATTSCPPNLAKLNLFDTVCKGLMAEVRPTGLISFCYRFVDKKGKQRQIKVADYRDVSIAQARKLVDKIRNQIAMGEDPHQQKQDLKKVLKLEDFIEDYYLPYIKTYKRSWKCDRGLLKNHILPLFGSRYLDEITKHDILRFIAQHRTSHAPGSVNRVLILLRYLFNLAMKWEIAGITKNPTKDIPLLEENNKKERYLRADEAQKLIGALVNSKNPILQYIIPMLILTGARKNEVLHARWEDINLEQRVWRIPLSKSGKTRHVPISDGVMRLLNGIPRISEYIFANPKTKKPYQSVFTSWDKARKSVDLQDVRIHDLRHTFASFLVNSGRSLYEVQKILGHTQVKTTQRYAHLSQDSLIAAANEAALIVPLPWEHIHHAPPVPLLQNP